MAAKPDQFDQSFGVIPVFRGPAQSPADAQYLLIQHHAGHWGFPKGHAEGDEAPIDAAARELREETGIDDIELLPEPTLAERYMFRSRRGKLMHKTVTLFLGLAATTDVTIQPEEIQAAAWGNAEQTRQRITFAEGRSLFDDALRVLEQTPWFAAAKPSK